MVKRYNTDYPNSYRVVVRFENGELITVYGPYASVATARSVMSQKSKWSLTHKFTIEKSKMNWEYVEGYDGD